MKTRTLLLLAVASGLVILVAGSVKLFLIADEDQPAHLMVGDSATVGDMTVTVRSTERANDQLVVSVRLVGADDPDGAQAWVFGTGTEQLRPILTRSPTECGATSATEPVECVLAFGTQETTGVLRYERAGETLYWDISTAS